MNEDERKKSTDGDFSWKTERATLTVGPPLEAGSRNFTLYSYPCRNQVAATGRHTRGLTIRRLKSHWSGSETSGHIREPLRLGAGWLAGRQAGRPAGRQPTVASRTGEANIDLTPEIPRSIDRRRYTWSRPPPLSAPSSAPFFSAVHPRRMRRRVPYSRWWRVWGLTHGFIAANPWVLAAAAAPCRAFRGETTVATTAAVTAAAAATAGERAPRRPGGGEDSEGRRSKATPTERHAETPLPLGALRS